MRALLIPFLLLSTSFAAPESQEDLLSDFNTHRDIVYKTVNGEALDMILFLPKERPAKKQPVMLYIHGGGWSKGDKFMILRPAFSGALRRLTESGIACASIEYRLVQPGKSTVLDCVVDCKDAARFLAKNADEFGIDSNRLGVWGASAGGHLALMTGLAPAAAFHGAPTLAGSDPTFQCIAAYFPPTSFVNLDLFKGSRLEDSDAFTPLLGGPYEDHQERAALLSPAQYLTPKSPPILLLHGKADPIVPIASSQHLMAIAEKKRMSGVELLTVTKGNHGFSGDDMTPPLEEINRRVADFLIHSLTE